MSEAMSVMGWDGVVVVRGVGYVALGWEVSWSSLVVVKDGIASAPAASPRVLVMAGTATVMREWHPVRFSMVWKRVSRVGASSSLLLLRWALNGVDGVAVDDGDAAAAARQVALVVGFRGG